MGKSHRHSLPQDGFTVIELIVVVAVLAVISALAAPSMQRLISSQRLKSVSYDMVADLTLARSEALKRGATPDNVVVTLTPQTGGWTNGWRVSASDGTVLGQRNPLGTGITVPTVPGTTNIYFDRNGRAVDAGGSLLGSNVKIGFKNSSDQHRCISLDPQGRPKTTTAACV